MARGRLGSNPEGEMSFWDHIEVLRNTLLRSAVVIIIAAVAMFFFKEFIYDVIVLGPSRADFITNRLLCEFGHYVNIESLCINKNPLVLNNTDIGGQFRSHMVITLVSGLVIAMPYILTEFWWFLRPALSQKERRGIRGFVFITNTLFMLGLGFGYFLISPLAIDFLVTYSLSKSIVNIIVLSSYVQNVMIISLSTGLVFELPVLVYFLTKIGIVTPELLKTYRKHAIVVLFIVAAIITPPDIFSQLLVVTPMLILYQVSIWVSKRVIAKQITDI